MDKKHIKKCVVLFKIIKSVFTPTKQVRVSEKTTVVNM